MAGDPAIWPSLPLAEWQETHDTLHMWMQIVGKTRLALAPKENHWWHVPLYVSARGLTTTAMPYRSGAFEVEFDFIDHRLVVETSDGARRDIPLRPQSVADFYREYKGVLDSLGIAVTLWLVPVEVDDPIPFLEDRRHAAYDADHARRFFRMLLQADRVTKRFKGRFLGKSSPVHFFWGAFDLALTRFSGRRAPAPKDSVARGDQRRVLAGRRRRAGARLLRVRAARTARLRGDRGPAQGRLLQPRAGRFHSSVRSGSLGALTR